MEFQRTGKNQASSEGIFQPPKILREPRSMQTRLGGRITLRVIAAGNPLPSYQWYHNGKVLPGAVEDRLSIPHSRKDHAGQYHCEVKNIAGTVTSRPASISVLASEVPLRQLLLKPATVSAPAGKPFQFSISGLENVKPLRIEWFFNGMRIRGAAGPELRFFALKKKYQGEYKAMLLLGSEIIQSNTAHLTVTENLNEGPIVEENTKINSENMRDYFFNPEEPEPIEESQPESPVLLQPQLPQQEEETSKLTQKKLALQDLLQKIKKAA